MRSALRLGAVLGVFALCACATGSGPEGIGKRIEGEELQRVIVGAETREQGAHIVDTFCRNGQWRQSGARVPIIARYRIDQDRLCAVYDDNSTYRCWRLFRGEGVVWFETLREGGSPVRVFAPRLMTPAQC